MYYSASEQNSANTLNCINCIIFTSPLPGMGEGQGEVNGYSVSQAQAELGLDPFLIMCNAFHIWHC